MKSLVRACLFLAIAFPVCPQILLNGPAPKPDVIHVDVDLVNVLCSVRNKHGAYIKGLKKEDFELRVDGKPRPITNFAPEVASPLTVALLLDVSGSVIAVIPDEKTAAGSFFAEVLRPGDRAMLVGFAELIAIWQDLTPSVEHLQAALDRAAPFRDSPEQRLQTRPRGGTLLYDAVNLVATNKLKPLTGRKTLILITDGEDQGSKVDLNMAVEAAQQADAVIYGIRYMDRAFAMQFGAAAVRDDSGMGVLRQLAAPTGGRAFDAMRAANLREAFQAIGEEMRNQYGLAFTPTEPAGKGDFHKLEIRVRKSGLKAQARAGYYR